MPKLRNQTGVMCRVCGSDDYEHYKRNPTVCIPCYISNGVKKRQANRQTHLDACARWGRRMKQERPIWRWAAYTHNSLKKKCNKRGWVYELDRATLERIAPALCPVFGYPINYGNHTIRHDSPSVDRFDNTKGYTIDNVRIISAKANMMKNSGTLEDVEALFLWMKNEHEARQLQAKGP